ncbi:hypothetical protein PO124_04305 [Bacillus licheniformis]|nr:hypothetical protein [Bacillus licheniformis]
MRHRCGLTLSRDHYRNQPISSSVPMISIWSTFGRKRRESGKASFRFAGAQRSGFDEGHLLEFAAQKR